MVGADHHRDCEEGSRRIAGPIEDKADHSTDEAGEGADLQQYMLVQDAPAQRLKGHVKDVSADTKHQADSEASHNPWRSTSEIPSEIEIQQ